MKLYAKIDDSRVKAISLIESQDYVLVECEDSDIFKKPDAFILEEAELVLDSENFKKVPEGKFFLEIYGDGNKSLFKGGITLKSNKVFDLTEDEYLEMFVNLNVYYELSAEGKPVLNQDKRSNFFKKKRINEVKKELQIEDYKIIKCYEAFILKETMPYDLEKLAIKRKAYRKEIDLLERTMIDVNKK